MHVEIWVIFKYTQIQIHDDPVSSLCLQSPPTINWAEQLFDSAGLGLSFKLIYTHSIKACLTKVPVVFLQVHVLNVVYYSGIN